MCLFSFWVILDNNYWLVYYLRPPLGIVFGTVWLALGPVVILPVPDWGCVSIDEDEGAGDCWTLDDKGDGIVACLVKVDELVVVTAKDVSLCSWDKTDPVYKKQNFLWSSRQ